MSKINTRATINANIKQNGNQEITGQVLNSVLNTMVDDYAEQEKVTELGQELEVSDQKLEVFGGVEIDFDVEGYIDKDTGNIASHNSARATSKYYPISTILSYFFTGHKNYSVAPVAYYNKDKSFIPGAYSEGAVTYNNQNINKILPIPSNAVYVRFSNWGISGYAVTIETEYLKKTEVVNNLVTKDPAKALSASMGVKLKAEVDIIDDKVKTVDEKINFCFDETEVDFDVNGYIDNYNGVIYNNANARATSKFYPIIGKSFHYLFTGNKNYSVAPVAYYDKDKNFIPGSYPEGDIRYNVQDINTILPIPDNAVYVRFSNWGTTGYAVIGRLDSPKKWIGRKWACLGDSLTENNIRTTLHYFDYIHDLTGIDIANCGSSGTGYANRQYGEEAAFYQRVNTIPVDSDVVTIFGSFNDMGTKKEDGVTPLPLGNINDTDPSESICGAINLTITNILNRIPTCRLGVVTPTPWAGYRPTINGNTPCELYVNAIIDICKLRSIPCLDLFRCSNLRPWDSSFRNIAYSKDGTYSEATSSTQNAIQVTASNIDAVHLCGLPNAQIGDWVLPSLAGVHPDELGHKIIAPIFKIFIESLFI